MGIPNKRIKMRISVCFKLIYLLFSSHNKVRENQTSAMPNFFTYPFSVFINITDTKLRGQLPSLTHY